VYFRIFPKIKGIIYSSAKLNFIQQHAAGITNTLYKYKLFEYSKHQRQKYFFLTTENYKRATEALKIGINQLK